MSCAGNLLYFVLEASRDVSATQQKPGEVLMARQDPKVIDYSEPDLWWQGFAGKSVSYYKLRRQTLVEERLDNYLVSSDKG